MTVRTDMKHMAPKTLKFDGIYRGVVEDNNDPDMLGRCKIRVWGLHDELKTEDVKEGIPTDKLPWGEPCLGLIEGSMSGHGLFSVPLQGTHVFCFFEGGNWESLRYFATAPGLPVDAPDTSKGFNDPDGVYPRADRLNESDYHRLARGVTEGTIVEHKDANLDTGVSKADGETWDEPASAYAAQYPNNIVLTTHRGITIEIDNTVGNERVHVFHPSNSYMEIDATGNLVYRNDGNRFEITRQTRNKHVLVDDNETIDADKTSKVGNDETIDIGHDRIKTVGNSDRETIGKDRITTIGQNDTKEVGNDSTTTIGNDSTTTVTNNEVNDVGGSLTETVGSGWTIIVTGNATIDASGDANVIAGGAANVTSTGPATVQGSVGILKGTTNTFTVS